jgi:hypothetical protein
VETFGSTDRPRRSHGIRAGLPTHQVVSVRRYPPLAGRTRWRIGALEKLRSTPPAALPGAIPQHAMDKHCSVAQQKRWNRRACGTAAKFTFRQQNISFPGKEKGAPDVLFFPAERSSTTGKRESCAVRFLFPCGKILHRVEKGKVHRMFSFSRYQNIPLYGNRQVAADDSFFSAGKYSIGQKKERCAGRFIFPGSKIIHRKEAGKVRRLVRFSWRENISSCEKRKGMPHVFFLLAAKYSTVRKQERCSGLFLFPAGGLFDRAEKGKVRRTFSFSHQQNIPPCENRNIAAAVSFFVAAKYSSIGKRERCARCFLFSVSKIIHSREKKKVRRTYPFSQRQNISS